jgi:glycosyltransferase involved in cell wall biosynthesis
LPHSNPEISIVVTCYNYGHFITDCLSSIQKQQFENWECLIVDDGSTDETKNLVATFLEDTRFHYFFQENKGVSFARNSGLEKSRGQYIITLDADDTIAPNFLGTLLNRFVQDPSLTLVYPNVIFSGDKKGIWQLPEYTYENLLAYNMIVVSSMYRKADFDRCGGYDTAMTNGAEDWEFWIRLLYLNKKAEKAPEAILYYRIKPVSKNADLLASNDKLLDSYRYITRKHAQWYLEHFESPLVLFHKYHTGEWEFFNRPWKAWYRKITKKLKKNR